jgi:hypothetical protein
VGLARGPRAARGREVRRRDATSPDPVTRDSVRDLLVSIAACARRLTTEGTRTVPERSPTGSQWEDPALRVLPARRCRCSSTSPHLTGAPAHELPTHPDHDAGTDHDSCKPISATGVCFHGPTTRRSASS